MIKKKLFKLKLKLKLLLVAVIMLLLVAVVNGIVNHSPLALFQRAEDTDKDELGEEYTYEEVQKKLSEYYSDLEAEINSYNGPHTDITYTNEKSNAIDCMMIYALLASDVDSDDDDESDPCILTKKHLKILKKVFNEMNSYEVSTEKVVVSSDGDKIGDFTVTKHECEGKDGSRDYKEETDGYALVGESYVEQIPVGCIVKIGSQKFRVIGTHTGAFGLDVCEEKDDDSGTTKEPTKGPTAGSGSFVPTLKITRQSANVLGAPASIIDGEVNPKPGSGSGGTDSKKDDKEKKPKFSFDGSSKAVYFVTSEAVPDVSYTQTNVKVTNMTEKAYIAAHPLTEEQEEYYEMMKDEEDTFSIIKSLGYSESGSGSSSLDNLIEISTPVTGDKAAFIETMGAYAVAYYEKSGIWPSIMVGQACVESGFGTSPKAVNDCNYFGMHWTSKRFGADCPYYENSGGRWPIFSSMPEGVAAYYSFMEASYYDRLHFDASVEESAQILKEHYCPEPDYPQKILSAIYSNNLTRFDDMVKK